MNKKQQTSAHSDIKGLIPELRFPEFENEKWIKNNLGSIGSPLMCKRILKKQTTTNPNEAVPFFKIGTFGKKPDAYIPIELYKKYKQKYSFPKIGEILISASGTIGRLVIYDGEDAYYQDSNIVWLGHNENIVLNSFLFYIYSTVNWQTSDGGVIKRLYNSNLREIEISYPLNPKEQQKIADCLSSLDDVINAETEKLDLLQDHKKGLLQKLFPQQGESQPKYRFPEFVGYGGWEEMTLNDVCDVTNGKSNAQDHVENGKYPLFDRSEVIKASDKFLFDCEAVILPGEGMRFIPKYYKGKFDLHQRAYALKNFKYVGNYIYYYILANSTLLASKAVRSTVLSLRLPIIQKFPILLPVGEKGILEQQKIANCLSSVDELIASQQQKIEGLKAHKKGLLQKLFPKIE